MSVFTKTLSLFALLAFFIFQALATPTLSFNQPHQHVPRAKKVSLPPGKRGLPFVTAASPYLSKWVSKTSRVTWAYDWQSNLDPSFPAGLEYVPMLWSTKQLKSLNWTGNVEKAIARGTKNILGFNEPDLKSQANMTVAEAVVAWKKYLQPWAGKVNLGGPAVTETSNGTVWLLDFLSKCTNCTIDFIPVHIYSTTTNIGHFQRHIQHIHNATGKPIWVTEFNGSGNETNQISFLKTLMPWLDAQDYVLRYAWYKCSPTYLSGTLCGAKGKIGTLGKVYQNFVL